MVVVVVVLILVLVTTEVVAEVDVTYGKVLVSGS